MPKDLKDTMPRRTFRRVRRAVLLKGELALPSGEVVEAARFAPVKVRLRCEGHLHTVSWFPGGALILHDHSPQDRAARLTLGDMGAKDCKCIALLEQVRSGRGVHRDVKVGLDGHIARPLHRCSEVAEHAQRKHKRTKPGDDFNDYDYEHVRDSRMMPTDRAGRKAWVESSVGHWKGRINEAVGRPTWQTTTEPLCWLLWHARGLGKVSGHTLVRILSDGVREATILLHVEEQVGAGVFLEGKPEALKYVANLAAKVVRVDDPLQPDVRWRVSAWLGPDGEPHPSPHLAAAAHLTHTGRPAAS